MKPYSQDLRQRVLRAVDQGRPRAEIVKTFDISLATLKRYLKQRRETGEVVPILSTRVARTATSF